MSKIKIDRLSWGKMLLFVMAVLLSGGAAMAVVVGENGSDTDPNEGQPLEGATPDVPGKGIDQQGAAATGSAVTQAGLENSQIEEYVSEFRAHKFPMHTDMLRLAQQVPVDTKEPEHYNIGEAILECETKSAVSNSSAKAESVVLPLYANDKKLFCECATVLVDGVEGYDEKGVADGSPLVLYVTSVDTNGVNVCAINGALNGTEMYVPDIPAGSVLHVMAPAMAESEVRVAPDNALPEKESAYLQKKVCAITYTDFFNRIKKKAKWNVQNLKNWHLATFRKKCTRSLLISAPTKMVKYNPLTGNEYVYTQKGVLRQIRLGYQVGTELTYADLIGITRMFFGKYSTVNEVDAYCGTKFIEKLLNIDFTKHKDISFKKSQNIGIDISSFETTFGKINFKVEHALDDLGYDECAVIFPMKDAHRYYYEKGKTIKLDHEKGEGGEVREAKSEYYIQDDCLMLTGYQSMIVGPATAVANYRMSTLEATVVSVDALADVTSPADGDIVYLTVADDTHSVGLYVYDGAASAWEPYSGEINV